MNKTIEKSQQGARKVRKQRVPPIKTNYNNTGPWLTSERLSYHVFLYHHKEKFMNTEMRRSLKLFNMMTKYVGTRTANQCRTQHHKYLKEYGNIEKILQLSIKYPLFNQTYRMSVQYLQQLDINSFFGIDEEKKAPRRQNFEARIKLQNKKVQVKTEESSPIIHSSGSSPHRQNQIPSNSLIKHQYSQPMACYVPFQFSLFLENYVKWSQVYHQNGQNQSRQ